MDSHDDPDSLNSSHARVHGARNKNAPNSDIFFAAVEATRMPMIVTDPRRDDNPIIFCNAAFERMTGYSQSEIVGRNCRFLQGPETDPALVDQLRDGIAKGEEVAVEILNYRKNGSSFWNALFVSPVFDETGEIIFYFGSQLDISRRKEAEDALHQAQKMEAVGKLTGGIAHDFNNLLQVILGYVDMLEVKIDEDDQISRRAVDAISQAASRGAQLTQQLLAFARKQELRDRLLNVNTLITEFDPVLNRNLGPEIQLKRQLHDDAWNCRIDQVQAELALVNIIANARDAMNGKGVVTITTANVVSTEEEPVADTLEPGEYVSIEISDTGPGVQEDAIDRVFDPFFSTKSVGKGTGLGLSMVYGFMRQSGGTATVLNGENGGAVFTLYFPRAKGLIEKKDDPVARAQGGNERILMVEDQPEVGELGKTILENLGYQVVLATSGVEALDVLEKDTAFGLLFTDIVMPGSVSGVELAQRVRDNHPDIAILLTTGYSDRALDAQSRQFDLVRKPYRRNDLATRVRVLLEGPTGVT